MEYWISSNQIQMGPYALRQLQHLWRQGEIADDTYYYDEVRTEWLYLHSLVGTLRGLFTAEEALVRLGQNRETGCLSVYNREEAFHVFVEGGFVVCAMGYHEKGEFALARALSLEDSTYEWFHGARPTTTTLRLNIQEYVLKHSIGRDIKIGASGNRKQSTVTMPKLGLDKVEVKRNFHYALVPDDAPTVRLRLDKVTHVVGREEHCDLIVNDSQVSRKHCLLEVQEQDETVLVKDLDSSNGTRINGAAVRNGSLKVGDQLSLGAYKLILHKEPKQAPDLP